MNKNTIITFSQSMYMELPEGYPDVGRLYFLSQRALPDFLTTVRMLHLSQL